MGNQNIIRYVPVSNKSILERVDEVVHKWFKPINHEFGNHFINNIAKANRSKMGNLINKGNFRYKGGVSVIEGFQEKARMEKGMYYSENIISDNIPKFLIKESKYAI